MLGCWVSHENLVAPCTSEGGGGGGGWLGGWGVAIILLFLEAMSFSICSYQFLLGRFKFIFWLIKVFSLVFTFVVGFSVVFFSGNSFPFFYNFFGSYVNGVFLLFVWRNCYFWQLIKSFLL